MQIGKTRFILLLVGVFMAGAVLMGAVCAVLMNSPGFALGNDKKLAEIQEYIDTYYLDDYDKEELTQGAYRGYVNALGDPYSEYFDPNEYESWKASATGDYDGVGITFSENEDGRFIVISVNPGSPAEEAGVEAGDFILTVDDKTYDNSEIMAAKIRGKAGTTVNLSIYHDGETRDIKMTREKILIQSVSHKMLEGNIGYIKLDSFINNTDSDFNKALKDIENKGADSLILDLRDNGGGLVDQSVKIADEFLDEGVVCYTEDKNGKTDSYNAKDGKTSLKTIVLINENSASASEILAGALKDNGFEIVGDKSFGKGIIQSTVGLDDGSALKLTVMQYLSPDKNVIHKKGIKPTVKIKDKKKTDVDEQLDKAEELLRQ